MSATDPQPAAETARSCGSGAVPCSLSRASLDLDYLEYRHRCQAGEKTEDDEEIYEAEELTEEELEMILQECDGVQWPCVCRKPRAHEWDLLCDECWDKIPVAKLQGFIRLDAGTDEHYLAAQQILRIATANFQKANEKGEATAPKKPD